MTRTTTLSGRETSRIGLGCGRLQGGAVTKASIRLVEQARKLGITHFDVAPSYGLGLAEDVLGDALAGDAAVTIATKVGIARPGHAGLKSLARSVLKPLFSATPALRRRLGANASGGTRGQFGAAQIEASVTESLRRLKRDTVDVLLLHQPDPESIGPEVAATMARTMSDHRAVSVGSGTGGDLDALVPFGMVRQYRWSTGTASTPTAGTDIVHGLLRRYPRPTPTPPAWDEQMNALGFDPADPASWPGLLLTLALASAPNAIVLISSTDPRRLTQAVEAIDWGAAAGERAGFIDAAEALIATGGAT
ncbi:MULTISPECIES: aldo/keto reductase [unclassified Sphingomonas]|uniref:aldo/keto reductase n=1 Tax=unclassified Sphingomonas TaxID=196159 RepID=UPI000E75F369|nr:MULTISPECIES: aldo/keto reductase [unclassified Sphingomonas]RKE43622.1 aldo/keto reductase family protein [Sphingomonas sp. PP-CC-1A-547]TCM05846.1 aldo/keto reductase family protein [Sphingomonas sp. PP-CC-3G-468]